MDVRCDRVNETDLCEKLVAQVIAGGLLLTSLEKRVKGGAIDLQGLHALILDEQFINITQRVAGEVPPRRLELSKHSAKRGPPREQPPVAQHGFIYHRVDPG
jgi:hypothetical protein